MIDVPPTRAEGSLVKPGEGGLHLWYWDFPSSDVARLYPGELEVGRWKLEGAESAGGCGRGLVMLNSRERSRYEKLIPPIVKQHYLVAHAGMQTILGSYLGVPPGQVEWVADRHGKPQLADSARLHFNLSHSSGANLLAVGSARVGIDIERIRPVMSREGLARRYYTREEQQELASLAAQASLARFFAFWTRKEAFVKLLGVGLQGELSSIDVSRVTNEGSEVARADGRDRCWLCDIAMPGEFRAAVATDQRPKSVAVFRLATNDG